MNSNGLVRFSPGELPLQRLCGQVKVLLFIVFTVLIIATFDFRILLAVTVISAAALVSLKPNWKLVGALMAVALGLNCVNLVLFYLFNPQIGSEFVGHVSCVAVADFCGDAHAACRRVQPHRNAV